MGLPWLEDFCFDLRYGARQLRRAPLFCGIAMVTLALGVGAKTAAVTLVNAALLRESPFPNPDRLKEITKTSRGQLSDPVFDSRQFLYFREHTTVFAAVAAARGSAR